VNGEAEGNETDMRRQIAKNFTTKIASVLTRLCNCTPTFAFYPRRNPIKLPIRLGPLLPPCNALFLESTRICRQLHLDRFIRFCTAQTLLAASICGPPAAISCSYRDTGAFSVAGPAAWNSLPDYLQDPSRSFDIFRRDLKTFLVLLAYTAHSLEDLRLCAI